jgi:hypothetical protein
MSLPGSGNGQHEIITTANVRVEYKVRHRKYSKVNEKNGAPGTWHFDLWIVSRTFVESVTLRRDKGLPGVGVKGDNTKRNKPEMAVHQMRQE